MISNSNTPHVESTFGRHPAFLSLVVSHGALLLGQNASTSQVQTWQSLAKAMAKSNFVASLLSQRRSKHMFLLKAAHKRKGNLGYAFCIGSPGQPIVRLAASSPKAASSAPAASGYITVQTPASPYQLLASPANVKFRRDCAEYKILHDLQSGGYPTFQQIHLYTERFPCWSCCRAIIEYLKKNKNVARLTVYYEPSWHWLDKNKRRKDRFIAFKSTNYMNGRLTFNMLYHR